MNDQGQDGQLQLPKCSAATNRDEERVLGTTVEYLPPEMLEAIFKNIKSPNDLRSCYNISSAWNIALRSTEFLFKMTLLYVLPYLSRKDLLACSSASKSWNAIVDACIEDAEYYQYNRKLTKEQRIETNFNCINMADFIDKFKLSMKNEPGEKIVTTSLIPFRRVKVSLERQLEVEGGRLDQIRHHRERVHGYVTFYRRNLEKILDHIGHLIQYMHLELRIRHRNARKVGCLEKMKLIRSCLKRTPNLTFLQIQTTCENTQECEYVRNMEAVNAYNAENPWPALDHLKALKLFDSTTHKEFHSIVTHYGPKLLVLKFSYVRLPEQLVPLGGKFSCLWKIVFYFVDANGAMQFGAFLQAIQCQIKELIVKFLQPDNDGCKNFENSYDGLILGANAVSSTLESLTLLPYQRGNTALNYDVTKFDQLRLPKLKELCLVEFCYPSTEFLQTVCPALEVLFVIPMFSKHKCWNDWYVGSSGAIYCDLYSEHHFWNKLAKIEYVFANLLNDKSDDIEIVPKIYTRNEYKENVEKGRLEGIKNQSTTSKEEET